MVRNSSSSRQHAPAHCWWQLALLCHLVLACQYTLSSAFSVQVTNKARQQLQEFVQKVPVTTDAVEEMSDPQRLAWSQDLGLTINETMRLLQQPTVPLLVDVKLVGFAGDGAGDVRVFEHDLLMYLKTMRNKLGTAALHPKPQHLDIHPDFEFRVVPVYHDLAEKVSSAISHVLDSRQASASWTSYPLHLVPFKMVDHLIEEEYGHGDGTYTIYILNPKVSQSVPYAYSYDDDGLHCPGPLWVGRQRYAWVDIAANISFFGPGPGGKGQVFDHSIPAIQHYKPEVVARAILPDLAALVWSACQHLVWPPLHHGELPFKEKVAIHLIYLHQTLNHAGSRIPLDALQLELQSAVEPLQSVEVHEHWLSFSACDHCVTAFASALRARTSRAPDKPGFHMMVNQYLDVSELERWIGEWRESILSEAGINYESHEPVHVVPVFIFDLPSKDAILLDGWRQAATLASGDVVAVRTDATAQATFFGCYEQQLDVDPTAIHRPVLAAVLESAWGVSDSALHWSKATGRGWNFLWSVGHTPFGLLSESTTLSFVQRDAMLRNAALSAMNGTVKHTLQLLEGYHNLAGPMGDVNHVKSFLLPDQVIPYHQRITLLFFKLHEACIALSKLKFTEALGYAESSTYDSLALRTITHGVKDAMQLSMQCAGSANAAMWWWVPLVSMVLALALFTWRIARGSGADEVPPPQRPLLASTGGAFGAAAPYSAGGAYSSGGYTGGSAYSSRPVSRTTSMQPPS